jgi:F0F1-type ATP synthase membrane subunit b/b'
MFRRLGALLSFLLVIAGLVAHQLHWLDGALLLRVAAVVALVSGLVGVVQLPWDLTFQARSTLARQRSARRRGLVVDDAEITFAERSAKRALVLAIVLHLIGAGLALAAGQLLGMELGILLSLAFIGSMALRPIHAFYRHTHERLRTARGDAEVPHADARALAEALEDLRAELRTERDARDAHRQAIEGQLAALDERTQLEAAGWRRAVTAQDQRLDRVLSDLERTVARSQEGAEVLTGIRAFVRLLKES